MNYEAQHAHKDRIICALLHNPENTPAPLWPLQDE